MNLIIYLLCFSLSFSLFFFILYRVQTNQLKDSFQKKILKLDDEIQNEEKLSHLLNSKINSIQKKEKSIHQSLTNIQLDIGQIDFSYKEVINNLGNHLN